MRKIILCACLLILMCSAVQAHAVGWQFKEHHRNPDQMRQEITQLMDTGWLPIGMSVLQGRLNILYLSGVDMVDVTAWYMGQYATENQLEQGINEMMNQDYIPMGLSQYQGYYYVIFVQSRELIHGWRIIPSQRRLTALKRAIQPHVREGYLPFGLGSNKHQFLTLMVSAPELEVGMWSVESYPLSRNAIQRGIDNNINQGMIPWGFLHHGGEIFVVYLGE